MSKRDSAAGLTLPAASPLAEHWQLDPEMVYLNHGSFGATPTTVLEAQSRYRASAERELVRFYMRDLWPLLDRVRSEYATQLGGKPGDFVMLHNATHAAATVFHNLRLEPGDEILATTHGYPACLNNAQHAADRAGAKLVRTRLPFPIESDDQAIQAVLSGVTDRTRFAMIDHVTSPTGIVLPVEPIVAALRARGIETFVDGAHAPGMLDVDLDAIAPAFYTANSHKWFCAPKGSAFLYVRPEFQQGFRPLALSNHADGSPFNNPSPRSFFNLEFDYMGTDDASAFLATPDAIEFMGQLVPGGWDALRQANRSLVLEARHLIAEQLGTALPAPDSMIGAIATVVLPPHEPERAERLMQRTALYGDALQDALVENHRTQVPVWSYRDPSSGKISRFVRISAQIYNTIDQYRHLADALESELDHERQL